MRFRLGPALFGVVLAGLLLPSAPRAESTSPLRFRLEAGPSFDRTRHVLGHRNGYALTGGVELGRRFGVFVTAGYEHYGGAVAPYLMGTGQSGPIPPIVRVEGDVTKHVFTGSLGLRYGAPLGALDAFVEVALGDATVMRRRERWVDPSTGAVVSGGDTYSSSVPDGEFGFGLRTRSGKHVDWTLGVKFHGWAQMMEAGEEGNSMQVSFGVVTP